MKKPTDDQIAEFEILAMQKSRISSAVLELPVDEADITLYLRPLSFEEFREYANGAVAEETRTNARTQATMRAAMFPSRPEISKAWERFAGLMKLVCTEGVEELAGKHPEEWIKVDDDLDADHLAELGISVDVVSKLRAQYPHKGQLMICHVPALERVFIVKRPTVDAWTRAVSRLKDEFYDATFDLAVDCCVYPDNAAAEFRSAPALAPFVFYLKLQQLASGSKAASAKKYVKSARQSAG